MIQESEKDPYPGRDYDSLAHGVQCGIGYLLAKDEFPGTPKSLMVGNCCRAADAAGLVRLLIAKGLFTEAEYVEAITQSMKEELAMWEDRISKLYGANIKLF